MLKTGRNMKEEELGKSLNCELNITNLIDGFGAYDFSS